MDALAPVSEPGGYRRRVFYTAGQQTLFRRCRSEHGLHDFVVGFAAAGPNVFLESSARDALDFSGPLESWASGVLYDNVDHPRQRAAPDQSRHRRSGRRLGGGQLRLWNSEATDVEVQSPPGAVNQAYGCKGLVTGDGIVWDPRTHAVPGLLPRLAGRAAQPLPRAAGGTPGPGGRRGDRAAPAIARPPAGARGSPRRTSTRSTREAAAPRSPLRPPADGSRTGASRSTASPRGRPASATRGSRRRCRGRSRSGVRPGAHAVRAGHASASGLTDDLEEVAAGMAPRLGLLPALRPLVRPPARRPQLLRLARAAHRRRVGAVHGAALGAERAGQGVGRPQQVRPDAASTPGTSTA